VTAKLKHCPFCYNNVLECTPDSGGLYYISCICGVESAPKDKYDDAVAAWNNRPIEYILRDKIERLTFTRETIIRVVELMGSESKREGYDDLCG